ncbi:MAG TPA: 23S rRNA (guanosine(2251)-2'-O)-methyltransferase RlmB [Gammaproteobacteria bacterium]|nr:23S rRNA (guanosine(2251)-2'-O)-methyltransferase RlmB [Gammaproteobacteria bacterium]
MSKKNLIFGLHAVEALLAKQPERIKCAYLLDQAVAQDPLQKIVKTLQDLDLSYQLVSRAMLDRLTQQARHQGIVVDCKLTKTYSEDELEAILAALQEPPLLLILDGIQDPHNLGACLRTADAAGVHAVIAPKDRSVGLTAAVAKVACGAAEVIPFVQVTNLARFMKHLKERGIWLFGLANEAEKNFYEADLKLPLALVLGNEEKGLRHLTRENCDLLFKIPMQGFVSSLNVSVAAGISLFEVLRQRQF